MQDNQSQTHWIYAAAIMDSDGCFMIIRHKSRSKQADHYDYFGNARITMISDKAVNYIASETGLGKVSFIGARPSRPNSKPLYTWFVIRRENLILFLEGILPYLKVKRERAELLLEFCKKKNKKGSRYYRPSLEELSCREDMYWKMREFNGSKVGATTKPQKPERACDSLNS